MRREDSQDLGLGSLGREINARAARIRRRASGRKAARAGGRALAALALAFALLVALPPFTWPLRGPVTSAMFLRLKPDSARLLDFELHKGIDIAAPAGTPVRACAPGIVFEAGTSPDLGNYVRVRHLLGVVSTYGHLSRIDVRAGSLVLLRGLTSLGAVGSTGRSTGPHLHFALQAGRIPLAPRFLLFFHGLRLALVGF